MSSIVVHAINAFNDDGCPISSSTSNSSATTIFQYPRWLRIRSRRTRQFINLSFSFNVYFGDEREVSPALIPKLDLKRRHGRCWIVQWCYRFIWRRIWHKDWNSWGICLLIREPELEQEPQMTYSHPLASLSLMSSDCMIGRLCLNHLDFFSLFLPPSSPLTRCSRSINDVKLAMKTMTNNTCISNLSTPFFHQ